MKTTIPLLAMVFLFCVVFMNADQKLKPKEQEYLENAMNTELQFTLPLKEAKKAWKRIEKFIKKYSEMKLKISDDNVIETLSPTAGMTRYGYRATQKILGEAAEIAIACTYGNAYTREQANKNAHLLAYYAQTGDLIPKLVEK
jgi:hypothetical protein